MPWSRDNRAKPSRGSAWPLVAGMTAASLAAAAAKPLLRRALQGWTRTFMDRLMSDPYAQNLFELVSATRRVGVQTVVETALRAQAGTLIERPLGSPKSWPHLDGLTFDFAQLDARPLDYHVPVDLRVTLGPRARRPLKVDIPILVAGMAYGLALSAPAKIALARGAALAGTASNTGEGPMLPLERQAASKLIVQYGRGTWAQRLEALKEADMVEIQLGQGASGGLSSMVPLRHLDGGLRSHLGLSPGQSARVHAVHPELAEPDGLRQLVERLREISGGVPIGVKLAAGGRLERDLDLCMQAGVDVIALDGAQAATKGSPPILQDDFGIPTLHALIRAQQFLEGTGRRERVSLLVGGGLATPGDFLKAVALGADAVYVGSVALFALAHRQQFKSLPWEPPTQVVFFGGRQADQLDVDEAAHALARFLRSCAQEMAVGLRVLGKRGLRELARDDLVALDPHTAEICQVRPAYRAPGSPARPPALGRLARGRPAPDGKAT